MRVAVCSRSGVLVDERFHRSVDYFVFELSPEGTSTFVERRVRPDASERVARDFDAVASALADCRVIVSLGFTGGARKALTGKGFALHEARGSFDAVWRELVSQVAVADGADESRSPTSESPGR